MFDVGIIWLIMCLQLQYWEHLWIFVSTLTLI